MQTNCPTNGEYPLSPDSSSNHQTPRRAKRPIPTEMKDNKYWEKRKRNNDAAKKSREAKRQQEYAIRDRMLICEQENAMLRQELARLRADRDATRLALANEGHHVPGYNTVDPSNNNNVDYSGRAPSPQPRMTNLAPAQPYPGNPDMNYDGGDPNEAKPAFHYGAPPPFQYGSPFGFYVAAYGQGYHPRYPVPVSMHEASGIANGNGYQQPTSTTEQTTEEPPAESPAEKDLPKLASQSTTNSVDDIKAENANLKTKLRDLEQAVSYMRDMTQHPQPQHSSLDESVSQNGGQQQES